MDEKHDIGHWTCNIPFDENALGFLYKITRNSSGMFYIGIKQLSHTVKLKPLKGKKRRRIKQKTSDWKTYTGSGVISDEAKAHPDRFSYDIISFHNTKRDLQYAEACYLINHNCLYDLNCYNQMFNYRLRFIKP